MIASRGWLEFGRLPRRSIRFIEFSLNKKQAGKARTRLICERVSTDRLSCQLLGLVELTKVNHHSREEIVRSRIPRRELLRPPEFSQTISDFPFHEKANPPERRMGLRKLRLDRHGFLGITRRFGPCYLLLLAR